MHGARHLTSSITAGLVYAALVFAVGFALGALRVTLIAPRLGETRAVLLEAPVMLAVSWMASNWNVARWQVPGDTVARFSWARLPLRS